MKLLIILILISTPAWAESELPITIMIVQCGAKENLEEACKKDERCCPLIEPASGTPQQ